MDKRKIILGGIGIAILLLGFFLKQKLGANDTLPEEKEGINAVVVNAMQVSNGIVEGEIEFTGRVTSKNRVDIFSEVGGISKYGSKAFKTGVDFRKGEALLYIDKREFESSLISTRSQFISSVASVIPDIKLDYKKSFEEWETYLNSLKSTEITKEIPEVNDAQLRLFLSGRNIYTSYHKLKELEARLGKYTIRAPFNGTLTEAYVNSGSLVRIGQQLGEFIDTENFELEASIEQSSISNLKKGMQVEFSNSNNGKTYSGILKRINAKVDPGTQLIKVFFEINDKDLKSGVYLEAKFKVREYESAVKLPLSSLVDNRYVFLIEKEKSKKHEVKVLNKNTEFIIVSGLPDNVTVITDRKNSAFEGSQVIKM